MPNLSNLAGGIAANLLGNIPNLAGGLPNPNAIQNNHHNNMQGNMMGGNHPPQMSNFGQNPPWNLNQNMPLRNLPQDRQSFNPNNNLLNNIKPHNF